jgi:hypothetical protein
MHAKDLMSSWDEPMTDMQHKLLIRHFIQPTLA